MSSQVHWLERILRLLHDRVLKQLRREELQEVLVVELLLKSRVCEQALVLILRAVCLTFGVRRRHLIALGAASLNQVVCLRLLVGVRLRLINGVELRILEVRNLLGLNELPHVLLLLQLILGLVQACPISVILLRVCRLRRVTEVARLRYRIHLSG